MNTLPPIQNNRSDAPAPTIRQGRDWPQARDQWPWTLFDPARWLGLGFAVAENLAQAAEIATTRKKP